MRYVIFGAGAVGGTIGGLLAAAGHEVALISRGAHLAALRSSGLRLQRPDSDETYRIEAAEGPEALAYREDDVVIMAMKTQDAETALLRLAAVAPSTVGVVCAQNGVESERLASRRFQDVYAMCVMLPADHLEPGVVRAYGAPRAGILDLGRYPSGIDERARTIAADLDASGMSSRAIVDPMRVKYGKLLLNLHNAVDALAGAEALKTELPERARAEARAVLATAGISFATAEEDAERRVGFLERRPVAGSGRAGGSTWQSLARGTGSVETDFLNGEVTLLGRIHGIPTPYNAALQIVMRRALAEGWVPGSLDPQELVRIVEEIVDRT